MKTVASQGKLITSVTEGSLAHDAGIMAGERLVSVNGQTVADTFDYGYLTDDDDISLEIEDGSGKIRLVSIDKGEERDIGLAFESGLMDAPRPCANNCVFCFVRQNPRGMRDSLYFRDDDWRLSFLTGNYITMTNMTDEDFRRLIFYKLSPINISVHAITPGIRREMMSNPQAGKLMKRLRFLKRAGIAMNFQIVLCPGINDGAELAKTVAALAKLAPEARSLSVVPVGLTCHREGLPKLIAFDKNRAAAVINQVEDLAERYKKTTGTAFVWAADELYLTAGIPIPSHDYYEGFPQLENGVGMTASFLDEFNEALDDLPTEVTESTVYVITGIAAEGFISGLGTRLMERVKGLTVVTVSVTNRFFGPSITVSGLLTGRDIISTMETVAFGVNPRLLLPRNALRAGEDVFLDDITLAELETRINVPVQAVPVNGADFINAVINI